MMNSQSGLVKIILIAVIVIVVLSIFKISVKSMVDNSFVRDNFSYVWKGIAYVWDNFLGKPVMYVYNFFKTYIWESSFEAWKRMRDGIKPRMLNEDVPRVEY